MNSLRSLGHHGAHGDAALAQAADQIKALVGGNAAADDQHDAPCGCRFACAQPRWQNVAPTLALRGYVSAHLVGGLKGDAVAFAQVGHEMAVVDRSDAELGGGEAPLGEERLDLLKQSCACIRHSHRLMGNFP